MVNAGKQTNGAGVRALMGNLQVEYKTAYSSLESKNRALKTAGNDNLIAEARLLQVRQIMS